MTVISLDFPPVFDFNLQKYEKYLDYKQIIR